MSDYKPSAPFNVAAFLMKPNEVRIKGVTTKTYIKSDKPFFCSFRTFGGTEKVVNDVLVVEDTATIETWYDPEIKANCRINVNDVDYDILGTPENVNMRNQYMIFKVRAVKGGA